MGSKSRNKGAEGERECASVWARLFNHFCIRGQQRSGREIEDIIGIPGVHIEVKRTEKLQLWQAIDQANRDAKHDRIPIVCHRPNRRPWVAIVELDNLPELVVRLYLLLASNGDYDEFNPPTDDAIEEAGL